MTENSLFDPDFEMPQKSSGPVICLGQTFESDEARRAHYTEALRKKLQDPEFRKIEGFPIGSDEDILNLSDPPYYTACPNPWIADFIGEWDEQKLEQPDSYHYHREPFAADVSEGRNDPIYNAHSYHTKVPHKAIMRYILHYTQPGDIVFDGFCGTGMTGVAAQLCGDCKTIMSLGYQVKTDGTILREVTDEDGKKVWKPFSRLGSRRAVLNDLSPVATFMAYNFNTPLEVVVFQKDIDTISKQVEAECGWMYETLHSDENSKGKVNFVIWSDVFVCPECTNDVIFWDAAVEVNIGTVLEDFPCPNCKTMLSKEPANQKKEATKAVSDRRPVTSKVDRAWISVYDNVTGQTKRLAKQTPVLINYTYRGKRYQKAPDSFDLDLIKKIEDTPIDTWVPNARMPEGKESRRNDSLGMTHVHLYYTKRNLLTLAAFWQRANKPELKFLLTSLMFKSSHLCGPLMSNYFAEVKGNSRGGWVGKNRSGTLYCPSIHSEVSIFPQITSRSRSTAVDVGESSGFVINTSSASSTLVPENSQDYIFIDPPRLITEATRYLDNFFASSLKYLGPLRDAPKPLYPLAPAADPHDVGLRGEHTASILELHKNKKIRYIPSTNFKAPVIDGKAVTRTLETAVIDWLQYLGVASSVKSRDQGKLGHELKVGLSNSDSSHDLTHVGVGVSQVLPILVMCLLSDTDSTLVFEQPELHLHPKVQTLLGDFFLSMALCNKQCIVETHSEYFIDRLRFRIAAASSEKELNSQAKIYFVEKPSQSSSFREVVINEYGAISDWPEGFFDQSQQQAEAILNAALAKKRAKKNKD